MDWRFRLSVYLILLTSAIAAGHAWAAAGAVALGIMLMMITVRPGGPEAWRPWPGFCKLVTQTLDGRSYYARCEVVGEFDQLKHGRTLFAAHPHGLLTAGWTWNLFWNFDFHERVGRVGFLLDEGLRLKAPTFRLLCDWYAGPKRWAGAATKDVIKAAMANGETLALIPGGFQEATICKRGVDRVFMKSRAGFLKYCLQEGYAVVPCYSFGESDTYTTFTGLLGAPSLDLHAIASSGNAPSPQLMPCPLHPSCQGHASGSPSRTSQRQPCLETGSVRCFRTLA